MILYVLYTAITANDSVVGFVHESVLLHHDPFRFSEHRTAGFRSPPRSRNNKNHRSRAAVCSIRTIQRARALRFMLFCLFDSALLESVRDLSRSRRGDNNKSSRHVLRFYETI